MQTVSEKVSLEINVTPAQAWGVIGAVDGVDKWFPSMIDSCRIEDGYRFCETKDGQKLEEEILEVNNETKTFRFAISKQDMLPVDNIEETVIVKDSKAGKALVEWSASFDATPDNATIAQEAFQNLWKMALTELENYINKN